MTCTSQQAERECVTVFKTMTDAQWASLEKRYVGVESNDPPETGSWFRWTMQHTDGGQASLSCQHGRSRWRREGMIFVQCFGLLDKGGRTLAQRMAESARDAYQGIRTPGGVWFRNATTREIGNDRAWYNVNAVIQFQYDEVK